ncbi:hypothetical protein GHU05_04920 [Fructobacillus tropaeoli]|uniref:hypothetical protein n=1 Tax=Fructobacillus tropaeoli TaxID=709323 RepID=UPI0014560696|nr:hypothetical protein [Fructobacillus tropaeoli]NLS38270.1 hypothetical protein [Fructobacillus tropaeoli]
MVIFKRKIQNPEGKVRDQANIYTEPDDELTIYVDDCDITEVTVDNLGHKNLTIKRKG